jgi:alkylation response protein AidB-like acyl-CoA dehydrogenase
MTTAQRNELDFVERARRVAPLIEAAAERIEAERRIPNDVLSAMHEQELFRMLMPKSVGGAELDLPTYVEAMEVIARADASTAWCLGQGTGTSMAAAYLEPKIAAEIFGKPDSVMAWGPPVSKVQAVAVDGGYRVTGKWSFASGSPNATWFGAKAPIMMPDGKPKLGANGKPIEPRTMMFPKEKAKITDIWNVIGLRGTGSNQYEVEDLFVPSEYAPQVDSIPERREDGTLYRFQSVPVHGYAFCAIALGIARSVLDSFLELAGVKQPKHWNNKMRESPLTQYQVAVAEAELRSARMFLFQSLRETWDEAVRTGEVPMERRLNLRLAVTHGMQQAAGVVDYAYRSAGATAIFAANPFERRFRDMHTVAQQGQAQSINLEAVGQMILGLELNTSRPI